MPRRGWTNRPCYGPLFTSPVLWAWTRPPRPSSTHGLMMVPAWRSVFPRPSPHVAITIRRFGKRTFSAADLVEQKALPGNVLEAAEQMLMTRRNILVSGGTGSGKTTLLNALIELLPVDERIVAIEDTLELRIDHSNCVRFEARGLQEGAVTIRDLDP